MIYTTQIIMALLGSLGFSILFNIRGKKLWYAAIGGMLSWVIYLFLHLWLNNEMSRFFISSLIVTIYSEAIARIEKTPTTTFLTSAVVPLIPGRSLYYTMSYAINGMLDKFVSSGIQTVGLSASIAAGIMAGSSVFRVFMVMQRKLKR
ncbi:threonine/serine exporter family protein [Proteiniborus sp.]|uniref:threonine/serine exporter family protein n=1 Tax=Proteiniborus sp. TaxID=2079015 RepID=UPI003325DD80